MIHTFILSLFLLSTPKELYNEMQKKDPSWVMRTEDIIGNIVPNKVAESIAGLEFVTSGGDLSFLSECRWGYSFSSHERLTPDKGSELIIKTFNALVSELKKHQQVLIYFNKNLEATSLPEEDICVKITFWSEDYDRIMPPNIAQIYFIKKKIYYNYSNLNQYLQPSVLYN